MYSSLAHAHSMLARFCGSMDGARRAAVTVARSLSSLPGSCSSLAHAHHRFVSSCALKSGPNPTTASDRAAAYVAQPHSACKSGGTPPRTSLGRRRTLSLRTLLCGLRVDSVPAPATAKRLGLDRVDKASNDNAAQLARQNPNTIIIQEGRVICFVPCGVELDPREIPRALARATIWMARGYGMCMLLFRWRAHLQQAGFVLSEGGGGVMGHRGVRVHHVLELQHLSHP